MAREFSMSMTIRAKDQTDCLGIAHLAESMIHKFGEADVRVTELAIVEDDSTSQVPTEPPPF